MIQKIECNAKMSPFKKKKGGSNFKIDKLFKPALDSKALKISCNVSIFPRLDCCNAFITIKKNHIA